MKRNVWIFLFVIFGCIMLLFFVRLFSPRELDDVHPDFFCYDGLLEKSDVLWVIPKFQNISMAENEDWCKYILSLNKTLGLHGVIHTFAEFETDRSQEYLQEGIDIFEECFGFRPEIFKAPTLKISQNNKQLIENNGLELKGRFNHLTHKIYHCNDSGVFSNKIIDFF